MNKDSMHDSEGTSLSYAAVSPHVLCPNSTAGNNGEQSSSSSSNNSSTGPEEGDIELPNDPTVPQTPTVEEHMKHKIIHYPL